MAMPTAVAPTLSVRRGAQVVQSYKAAFDASGLFRIETPDGAVVAKLTVGAFHFWVADESSVHTGTLGG